MSRPYDAVGWTLGRSMPQGFYADEAIFNDDLRLIAETQWILVDHESRLANNGDYFLFDFGSESIIILRDRKGEVRAFYNVCRHRGSRICLEEEGSAKLLRCPYHAWAYDLDGSLRPPRFMPEGFDPSENGLIPARIHVYEGLIFLSLTKGTPPEFERALAPIKPFLEGHGLKRAKIAARHVIPTAANWKLCVENFYECYHCRSAHKTYCSIHDGTKLVAFGAGAGSSTDEIGEGYGAVLAAWERETAAKGNFVGMFADGADSDHFRSANRLPIGNGALSETTDGKAASTLMGNFKEFDGGQTGVTFNVLSTILANNDHAVIFKFIPRGVLETDMETIWLVDEDAVEGKDYDLAHLTETWSITLAEDKTITENNQKGVLSAAYKPGVYSTQENRIADFGDWYMRQREKMLAQGAGGSRQ